MPDHNWLKVRSCPFRSVGKAILCKVIPFVVPPPGGIFVTCKFHGNAALRNCPIYRRNL